jgi:hypothetical protein
MRRHMIPLAIVLALSLAALGAASASAALPTITKVGVSGVTNHSAVLEAEVNSEKKATFYHFEYGPADCSVGPCTSVPASEPNIGSGSAPVPVKAPIEGLTAGTTYHFRVIAHHTNGSDEVKSPGRIFATYGPPQSFEPCPNDALRGEGPDAKLPDCRAYEQATPVGKNGGDTVSFKTLLGASSNGDAVLFMSYFGFPGGEGAQDMPLFLATRGGGAWASQGLLPPASYGENASVIGWQPDYSQVFATARKQGNPQTTALFMRTPSAAVPTMIAPYLPDIRYAFAGASADGSLVVFESNKQLPGTAGVNGVPNVYAWNRDSGELSLIGVQNDGTAPAIGTIAGPYDWAWGTNPVTLGRGGAISHYFTQEEHVVSADGSAVYFTAAGSGQLYLRRNPSQEQSALNGEGKCTEAAKACTTRVSASEKTNGNGPGGTELGGSLPAAFQAASADGTIAYLTSSEELTDDAQTGPESTKPPVSPTIGRSNLEGKEIKGDFLSAHASGIATDAEYIYWADPETGAIGRAKLNGEEIKPEFVSGLTDIDDLAVDDEYIYWANPSGDAIGRAKKIDGSGVSEKFIPADNPRGVAVDDTYVYWINLGNEIWSQPHPVGRAELDGAKVNQAFLTPEIESLNYPLLAERIAVGAGHVYVTAEGAYVLSYSLDGAKQEKLISESELVRHQDIAVGASHVYWSTEGTPPFGGADINRANFDLSDDTREFITGPAVEHPQAIAVDAGHIYWANDPPLGSKLGNDLYRFEAAKPEGERLTDLVAGAGGENGAEVKGVLGVSEDGSYLYFVANGVLTNTPNGRGESAAPGSCHGSVLIQDGACNLYLWHDGAISFIAGVDGDDYDNWTPSPDYIGKGLETPKVSRISADGHVLVFHSAGQFHRYDAEDQRLDCITCNPTGEGSGGAAWLNSIIFETLLPGSNPAPLLGRNLSSDGKRFFFETTAALVGADVNGKEGCPLYGGYLNRYGVCLDVYEWEAPGKGSCTEASPAYSSLDGGCIYLLSSGTEREAALFAGASSSGNDVFFFTRSQLVGQDTDNLRDVYDASAGGGLASQDPPPPLVPCEGDVCKPGASPPPPTQSAGSASFVGPVNPKPVRRGKRQRHHKQKKHPHKKKHPRAQHNRRASR